MCEWNRQNDSHMECFVKGRNIRSNNEENVIQVPFGWKGRSKWKFPAFVLQSRCVKRNPPYVGYKKPSTSETFKKHNANIFLTYIFGKRKLFESSSFLYKFQLCLEQFYLCRKMYCQNHSTFYRLIS